MANTLRNQRRRHAIIAARERRVRLCMLQSHSQDWIAL
jgi:hypothetical protein